MFRLLSYILVLLYSLAVAHAGLDPCGWLLTERVDLLDPIVISESASFDRSLVAYARSALNLSGVVEAVPPPTIPNSRVYIIRENSVEVAVLKIFFNEHAALTRELRAIDWINNAGLKQLRSVEALGLARVSLREKDHAVLLMSHARGFDVAEMVRRAGASSGNSRLKPVRRALVGVAKALAELHAKSQVLPRDAIDDIRESVRYESERALALINAGGTLERLSELGWLSARELELVRERIGMIISDFRKQTPFMTTVIHGDAHQGNFFYDPATGRVQTIDVETLIWALKVKIDSNADTGRFTGALEVNGIAAGLSAQEIFSLRESFVRAYVAALKAKRADIENTIDFYELRFFAIVLADFNGTKINEATRRVLLERVLRRFKIR